MSSDPRQLMRTLIASTTAWQTLVGATGSTAEKITAGEARIFLSGSEGSDALTYPHIVLNSTALADQVGDRCFAHYGEIYVSLFVALGSGDLDTESNNLWDTYLTPLRDAILDLQGVVTVSTSYIVLSSFEWDYQGLSPVEDQDDVWVCPAIARWGVRG